MWGINGAFDRSSDKLEVPAILIEESLEGLKSRGAVRHVGDKWSI